MNWSGRSAAIYNATSRVARLVTLHFIWMGLVLAGGVVLGVFPAWYTLLVAFKHELNGKSLDPGELWQLYRTHFWRANAFGFVTTILICGGLAEIFLLPLSEPGTFSIFALLVPVTTFWISYWTVNTWVLTADVEELSLESIRQTVPEILLHPFRSLIVLLSLGLAVAVLAFLPALALVAGASSLALIVMKLGRGAARSVQAPRHREGRA